MPKIQITNIEHIPWAKRLIIDFLLGQDCANPSIGGWEYIATACGYRNVCDDDGIIMVPNEQHPLHSNVIKLAGQYTFVWDYGGVQGLDPTEFDSEHSYLVQIGMYDATCNMTDPCSFANYQTQYGEEPSGTPETLGDANNTNNNCGPGYILKTDDNGCLYCLPITVDPPDPGDGILNGGEADPIIVHPPADDEFVPVGSATAFDMPGGGNGGNGNNSGPTIRINGVDVPTVINSTPGPRGLSFSDLGETEGTLAYGVADEDYLPNNYSIGSGPVNADSSEYGPGSSIKSTIYGTTIGGHSPTVNFEREVSSLVPYEFDDYVSSSNANQNTRRTADQLNISPHNLSSVLNSDVTINNTLNSGDFKKSTKAIDAITVNQSTLNIRGKSYISTSIPNQKSLNAFQVNIENAPALLNNKIANENLFTNVNALPIVNDLSIKNIENGISRQFLRNVNNVILNLLTYKDNQDFNSNFVFSLFAQDTAKVGAGVFVETKLSSRNGLLHNYKVYVYAKTQDGLKFLSSSDQKLRKGHILISRLMRVPAVPGKITVISIVVDSNDDIIGLRYKDVTIT